MEVKDRFTNLSLIQREKFYVYLMSMRSTTLGKCHLAIEEIMIHVNYSSLLPRVTTSCAILKSSSLALLALFVSISAHAGGSQTGQVTQVTARASDGLNLVILTGTPSGHPACATHLYWIIKDENSETGKKQLAMFMTAQATGKSVSVAGLGTCTRWPDGEDIDSVNLNDQ